LHPAAGVKSYQRLLDPVRPLTARDTPSTALVLIELHRPQSEFHDALLVVDHHHAARTQHGPGLRDRIEIHGHVYLIRGQTRTRSSARNDRLQLPPVANEIDVAMDFDS